MQYPKLCVNGRFHLLRDGDSITATDARNSRHCNDRHMSNTVCMG